MIPLEIRSFPIEGDRSCTCISVNYIESSCLVYSKMAATWNNSLFLFSLSSSKQKAKKVCRCFKCMLAITTRNTGIKCMYSQSAKTRNLIETLFFMLWLPHRAIDSALAAGRREEWPSAAATGGTGSIQSHQAGRHGLSTQLTAVHVYCLLKQLPVTNVHALLLQTQMKKMPETLIYATYPFLTDKDTDFYLKMLWNCRLSLGLCADWI